MLKYLYVKETFSEVPNEISLCIELSGCTIHCEGCHSKELWSDKGKQLDLAELSLLIAKHNGISCVCILGGENYDELNKLFKMIKETTTLKTCWYTGIDSIPKDINLGYLDFVKIGHFNGHPLTDRNTNQRFFKISSEVRDGKVYKFNELKDITYVFWNSTNAS